MPATKRRIGEVISPTPLAKRYEGKRHGSDASVTVNGCPLDLRLDLCNHSPIGFEWGYRGSGPAQLALALLAEVFQDDETALKLHQEFKDAIISRLEDEGWTLTDQQIRGFMRPFML
jgi:hypothetical protein